MPKTLIVGDVHLKASSILPKVDVALADDSEIKRIVFTGDYCDEWGATADTMTREIEELCDWVDEKRGDDYRVDLLFGNHDFAYLLGHEGPGTISSLYDFVRETLFPMGVMVATEVNGFLVTHAGLTQTWADEHLDYPEDAAEAARQINVMMHGTYYERAALYTAGVARGGFGIPSPLWADKLELETDFADGISQIVGHTPVDTCQLAYTPGFRAGEVPEIWFCDTFSLYSNMLPIGDGSMLVVDDDGSVSIVGCNEA